jgi:hypothetical protein
MGSAVRIGAALLSLAGLAQADLNFTPRVEEYDLEGVKLKQLTFADGERRVIYTPPKKWEYSGSESRLVLHPTTESAAEAVITVSKTQRQEVFDEATTKRLCDEVLASVPGGSINATLVSQQMNPLLIERKDTFLVVINYDYYSQPYTRSVMFLNRQNEQVRFQLTCYRNVFRDLQKAFQNSHYSWQNL